MQFLRGDADLTAIARKNKIHIDNTFLERFRYRFNGKTRKVLTTAQQFSPYVKSSLTVRIQYYDGANILKQIGAPKVIFLQAAVTQSSLKLNTPSPVFPGGAVNYEIASSCIATPLPGNTHIKLTLEKRNNINANYTEISTLYQVDYDFTQNTAYRYNGNYTPTAPHPGGLYRLKLEVTTANGLKEPLRYCFFYYDRSGFVVTPHMDRRIG